MTPEEIVDRHAGTGRAFSADGVGSFVREEGTGEPVVCLHGVPTSSFLYRKVLSELAARGLRGVAFDLPGLGLAERPAGYDYTWTGLGRFAAAAINALGLERYHLLVHDIGGPVGFELAAAHRSRVRSLLLLNTIVDADRFRRPLFMEPFAHPRAGPAWLAAMTPTTFQGITYAADPRTEGAIWPAWGRVREASLPRCLPGGCPCPAARRSPRSWPATSRRWTAGPTTLARRRTVGFCSHSDPDPRVVEAG